MPQLNVSKLLMAIAITATMSLFSCSPKDEDIKAQIETKLNAKPGMSGATALVNDGVATISGECKDETCKADCEKITHDVKGVKSVINNLTVPQPPVTAAPVTISPDDPLTQSVADATKDFASVKAEVKDGVVTLTGDIKKTDLPKLMKSISSLKPRKIENKLTIK